MADFINQIIFGLAIGSIYSLVAIGFTVIFRATGLLHFAHPDLMMVGGLIGYTLAVRTQMPLLIIFLVSGIGVAVLRKNSIPHIMKDLYRSPNSR